MKQRTVALWSASILCLTAARSYAAQVDFEGIPVGTVYGEQAGDQPGDPLLTQEGIDVTLESFFIGDFVGFIRAEVGGLYADFFPSTPLELDNISVRFDFSNLGFTVNQVTLDFQEFGGTDNFAVNDAIPLQLTAMTDLPLAITPNITATVDNGMLTLMGGPISSFQIGGQELAIDNIVAVPEPTTLILMGLGGLMIFRPRRNNPFRRGANTIR